MPRWLERIPLVHLALAGVLLFGARPAEAAASIWLQKGVSGFGTSVGVAYTAGWSGRTNNLNLTLGGGYSYKGVLELDLEVDRTFPVTDPQTGASISSWSIGPHLEVHPLKQSATMPISLGLSAGIAFPFYSSSELDAQGISVSAFGYSFGLMVYRFFRLGEWVGVTPAAGLSFSRVNVTFETPTGSVDGGQSTLSGGFGAYFAFLDPGGRIWGVAPSLAIADDCVQFQLQVGVVFAMP